MVPCYSCYIHGTWRSKELARRRFQSHHSLYGEGGEDTKPQRKGGQSSWGELMPQDRTKPPAKYCCILVFMLYYIICLGRKKAWKPNPTVLPILLGLFFFPLWLLNYGPFLYCTKYFVANSKNKDKSQKSHNLDVKRTVTSVTHLMVNLSYFFKYLTTKFQTNTKWL